MGMSGRRGGCLARGRPPRLPARAAPERRRTAPHAMEQLPSRARLAGVWIGSAPGGLIDYRRVGVTGSCPRVQQWHQRRGGRHVWWYQRVGRRPGAHNRQWRCAGDVPAPYRLPRVSALKASLAIECLGLPSPVLDRSGPCRKPLAGMPRLNLAYLELVLTVRTAKHAAIPWEPCTQPSSKGVTRAARGRFEPASPTGRYSDTPDHESCFWSQDTCCFDTSCKSFV